MKSNRPAFVFFFNFNQSQFMVKAKHHISCMAGSYKREKNLARFSGSLISEMVQFKGPNETSLFEAIQRNK